MHFPSRALLLVPLLVLTACGGGGGGGGGGGSPGVSTGTIVVPTPAVATVTAAAITIDSSNAKPVAADALDAAEGTSGARAGTSVATAVQVAAVPAQVGAGVAASRLASLALARAKLATGVSFVDTIQCAGGGVMGVSGTVLDPSVLSARDTITLFPANCTESVGGVATTLSGRITFTVVGAQNFGGSTFPQRLVMSMLLEGFTVTTAARSTLTTGDMIIDATDTSTTTGSVTLLGSMLYSSVLGRLPLQASTLKNYTFAAQVSGTRMTTGITASVEGFNLNPMTGASYALTTPGALVTEGDLLIAGSLKVAGNASGLLLTVAMPNQFTLQVDANGDGVYEDSMTTTKAELDGL